MTATLTLKAPEGGTTWWWADSSTGEVWPCEILEPSIWPGTIKIRVLLGALEGELITTSRRCVYDGRFNHPTWEAG